MDGVELAGLARCLTDRNGVSLWHGRNAYYLIYRPAEKPSGMDLTRKNRRSRIPRLPRTLRGHGIVLRILAIYFEISILDVRRASEAARPPPVGTSFMSLLLLGFSGLAPSGPANCNQFFVPTVSTVKFSTFQPEKEQLGYLPSSANVAFPLGFGHGGSSARNLVHRVPSSPLPNKSLVQRCLAHYRGGHV